MRTLFAIAVATGVGLSLAHPAFGQMDDSKLGKVHFETSCKPEAQKLFDRGNAVPALVLVSGVTKGI